MDDKLITGQRVQVWAGDKTILPANPSDPQMPSTQNNYLPKFPSRIHWFVESVSSPASVNFG